MLHTDGRSPVAPQSSRLVTPGSQLRRRRAASYRLPPLTDGRRDPLDPNSEEQPMSPASTAATIDLLRSLGFPWIPIQRGDLQAMWRHSGTYRRLAIEQAERNGRCVA